MSLIEDRLERLLDAADVRLIERGDLGRNFNAVYHQPSNTIIVRWGLDPVTRRCAIAHELGHAHNNDDCSTPGAERRADEWAAENLIYPDEVEDIAESSGYELASSEICAELGVTPGLFAVWSRLYEQGRIRDRHHWCGTCHPPADLNFI